jgi:putative transposase
MYGKRRWIDNVFAERLWRSVKYEEVYRHVYESPRDAARALRSYFAFYNAHQPNQSLEDRTPDEVCFGTRALKEAA